MSAHRADAAPACRLANVAWETTELTLTLADDWTEVVFSHVLGKVFHATRPSVLQGIQDKGAVLPSGSGLPDGHGHTSNSHAARTGRVAFWDFRRDRKVIDDHFFKCHPANLGDSQALLVLSPKAWPLLEPYETTEQLPYEVLRVPYIECWYPGAVPADLIERVILVTFERPPRKPGEWSLEDVFDEADRT
jgi:hypothetical protein